MILASTIIERLRSGTAIKTIGGSADYAAIKQWLQYTPAAFVLPYESHALAVGDNGYLSRYVNGVSQYVKTNIAIVLAVRNVKDARGQASMTELETLRSSVQQLLVGWVPEGACEQLLFYRGQLTAFEDQTLIWRDEFQTAYNLEM